MEHLTAKLSCFARAYHFRTNTAHVFADAAAEKLLGEEYGQIARHLAQGAGFFLPGFHGSKAEALRRIMDEHLAPSVLGRSAYCEAMLANEQRLGCKQYLLFASGYDTYALRHPQSPLAVFELDLPEMLADKQRRIAQTGLRSGAIPVPCDLSRPDWPERLLRSGFDPRAKTFAGLLGISHYLSKVAFGSLLRSLGSMLCEGSALCFDYPTNADSPHLRLTQTLAQGAGGAMRARYSAPEIESLLAGSGFPVYEHLTHRDMTRQYFSAYNASSLGRPLEAPQGVCYALAVKKP
ncbi:MAG: class I SAM-dependent methyltransferase [Clostridia bacterium]|nr:class I SAM-dependent methyltransferase [Clostridia bacterium]